MSSSKLVRDKIPQLIADSDKKCSHYICDFDEYKTRLYDKILEEVDEFIKDPCAEEAGDIYEVFLAILKSHEINFPDVVFAAADKKEKRGGFDKGIILLNVT